MWLPSVSANTRIWEFRQSESVRVSCAIHPPKQREDPGMPEKCDWSMAKQAVTIDGQLKWIVWPFPFGPAAFHRFFACDW